MNGNLRSEITFRASKSNPCEVCCTGTKGCSATADALHLCRGEPADPGAWKLVKRGDVFHCYRRVDDKRHLNENPILNGRPHNDPKPIIGGKAKAKAKPHPIPNADKGKPQNWREQVKKFFHDADNKDGRSSIAANLSLPVEAFGNAMPVPGCGYTEYGIKDESKPSPEWVGAVTFPMVDGSLEPCGILKRLDRPVIAKTFGDDEPKNKFSMGGGRGGLIPGREWKDGVLVCLHDPEVDRTTDGTGKVADLTLAAIKKLDVGVKFDAKFKGERVPTLREVLELAKGKIGVMIDLKEDDEKYTKAIAEEVREYGEPKRLVLGIRSGEHAKQFRKLLPEARQIGLVPTADDIEPFAKAGVKVIRLWPKWLADESLVPRVRKLGLELHLGTGMGTKAEVLPLLAHRPESFSGAASRNSSRRSADSSEAKTDRPLLQADPDR